MRLLFSPRLLLFLDLRDLLDFLDLCLEDLWDLRDLWPDLE